MRDDGFSPGNTYENVYLIVLDASGYSGIVSHNPRDHSSRAFDLLRERVLARIGEHSAAAGCARIQLWSWRGDGGIAAIHDDGESVARDVALNSAREILRIDLPMMREELRKTGLAGELRLRIAVHKGTIRYSADGDSGSIHSPEINFAAHLEEATPPDCLAISEDVHRAAGRHAGAFELVGKHESRDVYLMTANGDAVDARRAWLAKAGLTGSTPVFAHTQRPSQEEKARLVKVARKDVVDTGTALRTSAAYLTTTERPAVYRDAVLDFLKRGGTYRCVLLDPSCEATATLSEYRQEDLPRKIRASVAGFGRFKKRHGAVTDGLHVYQGCAFPGFGATAADIDSPDTVILYQPYLMSMKPLGLHVENGDAPHYVVTSASGALLSTISTLVRSTISSDSLERVL